MSHQFKKCLVWSLNHCLHQAYVVHLPSHGKHTSFHSQQLQTPSPCLTCAESGQHTKLLSDRLTFSTAPNPSLLSQTHLCWKWPTCKCLELFSDRLTFSTAQNPFFSLSLTCAESGQCASVSSHSVKESLPSPQLQTLLSLSETHLFWKWPTCKCLESFCDRLTFYSPQLQTLLSVCLRLTCAERGQWANVLSRSVTDVLHSSKSISGLLLSTVLSTVLSMTFTSPRFSAMSSPVRVAVATE